MHTRSKFDRRRGASAIPQKPLIAVTMDLEMSRHYPEWGTTRWDCVFHPSVMCVEDQDLRAVDLLCELAGKAGQKAAMVDLDEIARRAS